MSNHRRFVPRRAELDFTYVCTPQIPRNCASFVSDDPWTREQKIGMWKAAALSAW